MLPRTPPMSHTLPSSLSLSLSLSLANTQPTRIVYDILWPTQSNPSHSFIHIYTHRHYHTSSSPQASNRLPTNEHRKSSESSPLFPPDTMPTRKSGAVPSRAWSILRLALLWARRGGAFKHRLIMDLRILPKFIKGLCLGHGNRAAIRYGERELSFDDTPIFHVKMNRPASMRLRLPHIPCINPQVDFDYDFDPDNNGDDQLEICYRAYEDSASNCEEEEAEKSIDVKAEEFITKFYEQMKLQRQISYLEHSEMLNRGAA